MGCANFAREVAGKKFDEACICAGSEVKPYHAAKKVVLLGQCAIVKNKKNKGAFRVKGCPPNNKEVT